MYFNGLYIRKIYTRAHCLRTQQNALPFSAGYIIFEKRRNHCYARTHKVDTSDIIPMLFPTGFSNNWKLHREEDTARFTSVT